MKSDMTKYPMQLRAKADQVRESLRNRGIIAMEQSAEETEQILLRDERDFALRAVDRDTRLLKEIEAAQQRIRTGDYGICEECEGQIPAKRLDALPWARRCVACQEKEDRLQAERSFRPVLFAA